MAESFKKTAEFCLYEVSGEFLACKKCGSKLRLREGRLPPKRICGKVDPEKFAKTEKERRERISFNETIPAAKIECEHRGQSLHRLDCPPCQSGGADTTLYKCSLHAECTIHNLAVRKSDGSRYRACATCEDRSSTES